MVLLLLLLFVVYVLHAYTDCAYCASPFLKKVSAVSCVFSVGHLIWFKWFFFSHIYSTLYRQSLIDLKTYTAVFMSLHLGSLHISSWFALDKSKAYSEASVVWNWFWLWHFWKGGADEFCRWRSADFQYTCSVLEEAKHTG